ncbi:hypothetical protein ACFLYO_02895 [Chloroflexota bacterium]
MRVVINKKRVSRNRKIAQYAFFITLGILVLGLFVTNAAPTNPILFFSPVIVLPVAIIATLFSVRMANLWLREPRPEVIFKNGLKGLSSRSVLYHYVFDARHVLISPEGVFTFTVRQQDGYFTVNGNNWRKRGGIFSKFTTLFRQDMLGKPDQDAAKDQAAIQALIDQVAPDSGITVEAVILFTSENATVEVTDSDYPVIYADPKNKPNLKTFFRDAKKRETNASLDQEQIEALENLLAVELEEMA